MVRVRYAPSPTGSPHVGNIRTALFDYLLARKTGGTFIVRIEDTDRAREVPGALEDILESLKWLGMEWDEGPEVGGAYEPYFQSRRLEIYTEHAERLLQNGKAYKCFCSAETLNEMREYQRINKLPTGYDRRCRSLPAEQIQANVEAGMPYVIRLAMPLEGTTTFEDAIRGKVEYENRLIDDQVLLKTDGWPTYHLANVVDDYLQKITHVIRGEEWIASTPKHIVLYEAFGWEKPIFVHAPVIKGPDGTKLSKRHGDTRCLDYRDKGYLGSAVANFIALIGWSPKDDREVMTLDEMVEAFSLDGLQPSPGVFDIQKLQWMNGAHIRALPPGKLYQTVQLFDEATTDEIYKASQPRRVLRKAFDALPETYVTNALVLEQERVKLLTEFAEVCEFFFTEDFPFDEEAVSKWRGRDHVLPLFNDLKVAAEQRSELSATQAEHIVDGIVAELGLAKRAEAIHPLRLALTGRTKGPGLWELMEAIGPERIAERLHRAKALFETEL
jgi:glutamyl-tRNA synthetase